MARAHDERQHLLDVPDEALDDGATRRVLSRDEDDGSYTAVLSLLGGYRSDPAPGMTFELFVLDGEVEVAGHVVPAGDFIRVGARAGDRVLTAEQPAQVVLMPEPGDEADVSRVDVSSVTWESPAGFPAGVLIKVLHRNEATGDATWLQSMAPGSGQPRIEIHEPVDECLLLQGDVLIGGPVEMTPGAYFWRAPSIPHGPIFSRDGALCLFRARGGGGLSTPVTYMDAPGWDDVLAEYRRGRAVFTPVQTTSTEA